MTKKKPFQQTIAVDFDGTLHAYIKTWSGIDTISDGPVAGAMAFLKTLVDDPEIKPVIVSSRLKMEQPQGWTAVRNWLEAHLESEFGPGEGQRILNSIAYSHERPPASVTIDDRAMRFEGVWPTTAELKAFKPWNKRPDTATMSDTQAVEWVNGQLQGVRTMLVELQKNLDAAMPGRFNVLAEVRGALEDHASGTPERARRILRAQEARDLKSLIETAWDLGAATAYSRRDRAADYEADGKSDETIRGLDVGWVIEKARKDGVAPARPTVDGAPVLSVDELPVPERIARYAAARGMSVDEVLVDPDVLKVASKASAKDIERTLAAGRAL